jgi:prepilin-type N-terminal cleavage/methylation domain-containing protein
MKPFRWRSAFTLLELVFVVAIVAILASMAIPRFSGAAARHRAGAAARRVASDLALARKHAKQSSASQAVVFDAAADSYQLTGMSHSDHPANEYVVRLGDEPYRAAIVSADFGGQKQVVFDGYGMPDSGGTVTIRVGTEQRVITLDVDTGEASVQ